MYEDFVVVEARREKRYRPCQSVVLRMETYRVRIIGTRVLGPKPVSPGGAASGGQTVRGTSRRMDP